MKLSFTSYLMAKDLNLDQSFELAKLSGCAGVEFRTGDPSFYKHGVEVELTAEERRKIRRRAEDDYLEISCIASGCRFESPDIKIRQENIELAKENVKLAYDLGCPNVRVFGNDVPEGVNAQDCVEYVTESIAEVGEFADNLGINVLLEMHDDFNYWGYALPVVKSIDKPNVGILYNCDLRDLIFGSMIETFERVKKYVRHVHMHDLDHGYPYLQLFQELYKMGYEGYLSAEIYKVTSDPIRVLTNHNIGVKALIELAKHTAK